MGSQCGLERCHAAGGTFRLVVCNNASSNVLNVLQLGEITTYQHAITDGVGIIQSKL